MDLGEEIDKSIDRVLIERDEKKEEYEIRTELKNGTFSIEILIGENNQIKRIVEKYPVHLILDTGYPDIILDELLKEMFEILRA